MPVEEINSSRWDKRLRMFGHTRDSCAIVGIKMAQVLGVTVEDLLIVGDTKLRKQKAAKNNSRPVGKSVRSSIASPKCHAASRNTSSTGSRPVTQYEQTRHE